MNTDADPTPVRVLVVEDDTALLTALGNAVRAAPGLALWGSAASLAAARQALRRHGPPDALLIDLGLPDGDGTQLIREVREVFPEVSVLVSTVFNDEAHVLRAIEAGAHGYLLKDGGPADLVRALRQVRAGGSPLSPAIARHLIARFAAPPRGAAGPTERLSPREAEILTWVARGHSVTEVAASLGVSAHTIATHVKNIYAKLGVSNRMQAVNRARESGQIP